jgi:hypothetical protein
VLAARDGRAPYCGSVSMINTMIDANTKNAQMQVYAICALRMPTFVCFLAMCFSKWLDIWPARLCVFLRVVDSPLFGFDDVDFFLFNCESLACSVAAQFTVAW